RRCCGISGEYQHLVIPGREQSSRTRNPEIVSARFWVRAAARPGMTMQGVTAPRNDGQLFRCQNQLKPAQSNKRLEGQTDEYSSRQYAFRCGPAGQAS